MTMPVGFRTASADGSLYAIDDLGYTTRHCLTGHSNDGQIEPPHRNLYLTHEQAEVAHQHFLNPDVAFRLLYLDPETREFHLWRGDDALIPPKAMPGLQIHNRNSDKLIASWPTASAPVENLTPFEIRYFTDINGQFSASRHIGHPIYDLYQNKTEFDDQLKKAGFPPFFDRSSDAQKRLLLIPRP